MREVTVTSPFATKTIGDKSLFKRVMGIQQALAQGENSIVYTIPYPWAKITGVELVGGEALDTACFFILAPDDTVLNQFGCHVNLPSGFYVHSSEYDADLYQGLKVKVVYVSKSAKTVGVNFILNEVKE